jgi:hypothetical protein
VSDRKKWLLILYGVRLRGTIMTHFSVFQSLHLRHVSYCLMGGLGLVLLGCASHVEEAVPNWSGELTQPVPSAAAEERVPEPRFEQGPKSMAPARIYAFTQGCNGSFVVRDRQSQALIARGRAFNAGTHLVATGGRGKSRIITGTKSQSVTFLPDCGCANNQSAANAPTTNTCAR